MVTFYWSKICFRFYLTSSIINQSVTLLHDHQEDLSKVGVAFPSALTIALCYFYL